MIWQELTVAVVVGLAVVYLYQHLRGMLRIAKPGTQQSCHGCDDCDDGSDPATSAVDVSDKRAR